MSTQTAEISSAFIWRRVHSLMGFWLVLYLSIHLITNSQAALWVGDDGHVFVRLVNFLEGLPYLQVVEVVLIGFPLLIHAVWGVKRALSAKLNSFPSQGASPSLGYNRNRAFTWQRLSSWILLVGIIWHVVEMRFLDYPKKIEVGGQEYYLTDITFDPGLYTLAPRLDVQLFSATEIAEMKVPEVGEQGVKSEAEWLQEKQTVAQEAKKQEALRAFSLAPNERLAMAKVPGVAILLTVRDTFKSPLVSIFYTIFVLAAAFHAFNGFWTFLITWGVILSYRSQKAMLPVSAIGMLILAFLGLAAIWGSYWINLHT